MPQGACSFEEAYARHGAEMLRAALAVLQDPALAEDVVQDVFLRLWAGGGYDAARGPLGPYLRLMARSRALDLWRARRARDQATERLHETAATEPAAGGDPAPLALRGALSSATRDAVRRLPPAQREVIGLAYWGGLSSEEMAAAAGIPVGTAKSRVRLAMLKLRRDPLLAAA